MGCAWDIFNSLLDYPDRDMKRLLNNQRNVGYLDDWDWDTINDKDNGNEEFMDLNHTKSITE